MSSFVDDSGLEAFPFISDFEVLLDVSLAEKIDWLLFSMSLVAIRCNRGSSIALKLTFENWRSISYN